MRAMQAMLRFVRRPFANFKKQAGPRLLAHFRPVTLNIVCPTGNTINVSGLAEGIGDIAIAGTGNHVEFGKGSKFKGSVEIRGKNNRVIIGADCVVRGKIVVKGRNQTVSVGEHTTFQSIYLLCDEHCDIRIGRWCMFSRDIEVRTTDAHSVVDAKTGLRLNQPDSVLIGDHVWVGVGALISKGAVVPEDCVVGAYSFVNSIFAERQVIIAGTPAKVVKQGVTWHRSRKGEFSMDELDSWRAQHT